MRLVQFRRIGKGCISYILESNGEAIVIDPVFPIEEYIKTANEDLKLKITKVFDTHQHADHVSAAKALAEKTNAALYQSFYEDYSKVDTQAKGATVKYNQVHDGDLFKAGLAKIKAIHTPGHTAGSISLLVEEDNDDDNNSSYDTANLEIRRSLLLLFTGDVLFVNGIGRPDLRDRAQEFAELLYDTLHNKIMSLRKDTLILPGHFDYDLKIGELVASTIEDIKKNSILLNYQKQDFVRTIASKVMSTPPNYKEIISINKLDRELPTTLSEIYELEIGPNRCSISNGSNTSSIGYNSTNSTIENNSDDNNYVAKLSSVSSVDSSQN